MTTEFRKQHVKVEYFDMNDHGLRKHPIDIDFLRIPVDVTMLKGMTKTIELAKGATTKPFDRESYGLIKRNGFEALCSLGSYMWFYQSKKFPQLFKAMKEHLSTPITIDNEKIENHSREGYKPEYVETLCGKTVHAFTVSTEELVLCLKEAGIHSLLFLSYGQKLPIYIDAERKLSDECLEFGQESKQTEAFSVLDKNLKVGGLNMFTEEDMKDAIKLHIGLTASSKEGRGSSEFTYPIIEVPKGYQMFNNHLPTDFMRRVVEQRRREDIPEESLLSVGSMTKKFHLNDTLEELEDDGQGFRYYLSKIVVYSGAPTTRIKSSIKAAGIKNPCPRKTIKNVQTYRNLLKDIVIGPFSMDNLVNNVVNYQDTFQGSIRIELEFRVKDLPSSGELNPSSATGLDDLLQYIFTTFNEQCLKRLRGVPTSITVYQIPVRELVIDLLRWRNFIAWYSTTKLGTNTGRITNEQLRIVRALGLAIGLTPNQYRLNVKKHPTITEKDGKRIRAKLRKTLIHFIETSTVDRVNQIYPGLARTLKLSLREDKLVIENNDHTIFISLPRFSNVQVFLENEFVSKMKKKGGGDFILLKHVKIDVNGNVVIKKGGDTDSESDDERSDLGKLYSLPEFYANEEKILATTMRKVAERRSRTLRVDSSKGVTPSFEESVGLDQSKLALINPDRDAEALLQQKVLEQMSLSLEFHNLPNSKKVVAKPVRREGSRVTGMYVAKCVGNVLKA